MVAPSLLKEDIGVFESGPSTPSTSKGNKNCTRHNFNRGVPCARTPCIYAHKCNRSGCGKDHPGIRCPNFFGTAKEPLPGFSLAYKTFYGVFMTEVSRGTWKGTPQKKFWTVALTCTVVMTSFMFKIEPLITLLFFN